MPTWIYDAQQRLAITHHEAVTLGTALGLLLLGLAASAWSPTSTNTVDAAAFAEEVAAVQEAATAPISTVAASEETPPAEAAPAEASLYLDLNSATADELTQLPGIGPKRAATIVDYRLRRGGFRSVDELMRIRGIGPKTLERLSPLVHV